MPIYYQIQVLGNIDFAQKKTSVVEPYLNAIPIFICQFLLELFLDSLIYGKFWLFWKYRNWWVHDPILDYCALDE